jgi:serine/threonine protein kinase/formylglycine-generating enzyme required for sulfatase activity
VTAHLGTHLSADALRGFAAGQLDDQTAAAVMNHLDTCPDCCRAAAGLTADDFLDRLRRAHSPGSTPAPGKVSGGLVSGEWSGLSLTTPHSPIPTPHSPIANLPPELANNPQYEVLRELGRGGMGVVYLARNKLLDRLEVLKVVNKALLDRPGAVERFLREIRAAAKLNHANVVAAYSAVQSGELLAFAMEYVEGEDLAQLAQTQGPLPVAQACDYVQQAALGLQHAFEKQMVHRDIKPQNLILAREGETHIVKVLDFGLAKVTRAENEDPALTDDGAMLGTPGYVAPEQTLDAAKADIRADVYSLGCTLYYLLTGAPPFEGRSRYEVLQAHQSVEAKPLNLVRPEVPEELAAVVRKMMAKDPAQRYQTPLALVQALAAFVTKRDGGGGRRDERKPEPVLASSLLPPPSSLSPVAGDTLAESGRKTIGPRRRWTIFERRPAGAKRSPWRKWLIGGGIAAGVLLIGLLALLARGVFRVKTPEGTLVVNVNVPNPDVYVDGNRVTVRWQKGGKRAEIRVQPGTRRVKVTKDEFAAFGELVELSEGQRRVLWARLEQRPRGKPRRRGKHEGRRAGEERDDNALKMKFCWCPARTIPGPPRSPGIHAQGFHLPGFWMGKYEVTQSEWARLMGSMPSHALDKGKGDRHPIYYVSHDDATQFCRKLTGQERKAGRLPKGWAYRLPTDTQWEYACRAGTTTATAFGAKLDSTQANFNGDWPYNGAPKGPNRGEAVKVGSFRPNAWGIYDMHGNVGELIAIPGRHRGGSWYDSGRNCCSAISIPDLPDASEHVGFRVACVPSRN